MPGQPQWGAWGLIGAGLAAAVGFYVTTKSSGGSVDMGSSSSSSSLPRAKGFSLVVERICQAHVANVIITGPDAYDKTNLVHEVLNLDLDAYPFNDIRGLATREPTVIGHANECVSQAWTEALAKIEQQNTAGGGGGEPATINERYSTHQAQLFRAVDLAAGVFNHFETRLEYVQNIWPIMKKSGRWLSTGGLKQPSRYEMLKVMDQWCSERGFRSRVGREST